MTPGGEDVRGGPTTPAGREGVRALLAAPGRALVALDFDGTLAPIVPDPATARAEPGVVEALTALAPHLGGLAIVTGRPVRTVLELSGLRPADALADLAILGHYGLERWNGETGEVARPEVPAGIGAARRELPDLVARVAPGAFLEDKELALAVHTRRAPAPADAFEALRVPLEELADRLGLALEPGRFVLELRPRGMDKGAALRSLVDGLGGPAAMSAVVFVGDDLGDLAAFRAVVALRAEGVPGVVVCSGSDEVEQLAALADVIVPGPAGVVAWLGALASALVAGSPA